MAKKLAPLPRVTSKTITVGALLGKIKRLILAEPKRLNMDRWLSAFQGRVYRPVGEMPACGTIGCMAGWGAVLLRHNGMSGIKIRRRTEDVMTEVLGFDKTQHGDTYRYVGMLFDPISDLSEEGEMPDPGTRQHAAFIAKRIDTYLSRHPEIVKRKIVVADVQKALRA